MEKQIAVNKPSQEQVAEWDRILDEYESSVGLPQYSSSSFTGEELNGYFYMDRSQIEKLTPEDCGHFYYGNIRKIRKKNRRFKARPISIAPESVLVFTSNSEW